MSRFSTVSREPSALMGKALRRGIAPADGQVLAFSATDERWYPSTPSTGSVADGSITNAKVASDAAIAWSKLSKSGASASDVGAAAASHTHAASDITSGTVATDRLGSGTANSSTFLRGDQTWAAPAGGSSDLVGASAPIQAVAVNNSSVFQTLATKSITVTAGDQIEFTVVGTFLNNSGGTVTPVLRFVLGSMTVDLSDGTTSATNASNRSAWVISGRWSVQSTSNVIFAGEFRHGTAAAANTAMSTALANNRSIWQTSASNLTGAQTATVAMRSSTNTATQTFTVHSWQVRKTGAV